MTLFQDQSQKAQDQAAYFHLLFVVQSRGGDHHRRSRKSSSPSMAPNQQCCLIRQPYDDFTHIYMLVLFFFYGQNYGVFQAIFFISFPRSLIQRFDLPGRGIFLLSYSRYLAKTHVRTSSTLVLILRFDKTSILFLFFVAFFLFVLTFFEDIISFCRKIQNLRNPQNRTHAKIDQLKLTKVDPREALYFT